MTFPPSLQAIFNEYTPPGTEVPEVVWRLCSEACRLQRETDLDYLDSVPEIYHDMRHGPLVIPEPE